MRGLVSESATAASGCSGARLCSHDRACAAPAQAVNVPLHGSPSHCFAHLGFREKNNTSTGTYTRKGKERMPVAKRTVLERSSASSSSAV